MSVLKIVVPVSVAAVGLFATPAFSEPVLSVYGGMQGAPHSTVSVTDGTRFVSGWEGRSFASPPYYGVRATWWMTDLGYSNVGLSIDFSHSKVYADDHTLKHNTPGWTHFEFSDGLNLLTANVFYRFQEPGRAWTPYVGLGAGANIPHVEVFRPSGKTWNYQLGGMTGQATAGLDYQISEHFSVFTEYKFNYSRVNVKIDGGDRLKTNVITNAVNVGLSYRF